MQRQYRDVEKLSKVTPLSKVTLVAGTQNNILMAVYKLSNIFTRKDAYEYIHIPPTFFVQGIHPQRVEFA